MAFIPDNSSTISQGIRLWVFSSALLGITSNSSPICASSSRLLGEADAKIILFMMHLRYKHPAVHQMLLLLGCLLRHMAEFQLGVIKSFSSFIHLLVGAVCL